MVRWTAEYFTQHQIPSPRLDAEVLLSHVLGVRRLDLYLQFDRPVETQERARYRELVRLRAAKRVPVAYLTGCREFWSRSFEVSPAVLIPRPDTETLVAAALEIGGARILEVGVGSGVVAGTLAAELPHSSVLATDVSAEALAVARRNFERLGVADRVTLLRANALSALRGPFDLIVSNPPYIPSGELAALSPELQHEPVLALDGGPDGLDVVRQMLQDAARLLSDRGTLLLEVGADQARSTERLMREAGAVTVEWRRDLSGIDRVALGAFHSAANTDESSARGSSGVGTARDLESGADGRQRA